MRLWHIDLLPYLPDAQFKGQLRELVLIMRTWRDKGRTNHLLINFVMDYPKADLVEYFNEYDRIYADRYDRMISRKIVDEFSDFYDGSTPSKPGPYPGHMDLGYLDVCYFNLFEKHYYGVGKNRIGDGEWDIFERGSLDARARLECSL